MTNFVRSSNPIWSFVDLVGKQLDDTYYIFFLNNTLPYLPQPIYHDSQGSTPWSNPVQFFGNGTLNPDIFFDESLVYRMEIRQGSTQSDPLIYVINNYIPGNGDTPTTETGTEDNQITNPQFSLINFVSPLTITTSGIHSIAPGWDLVLTGSGSSIVSQVIFTGSQNLENAPTPPYAIEITTTGWTTAYLQQTFYGNGGIWANTYISMSILARSNNSLALPISLFYTNNIGTQLPIISEQELSVGIFETIQGIIPLGVSSNTTPNNISSISMQIQLPPNAGDVQISNVQVMGQVEQLPVDFSQTPEETIERQKDHTFHNYFDSLLFKSRKNILTGWNFSLNPWQFVDSSQSLKTNQTMYICDQTILHQQTNSTLITGKSGLSFDNNLVVIANSGGQQSNQFALIQYIDPETIMPYWGKKLSVMVNAAILSTVSTPVRLKVRLIHKAGLPNTLSPTDPISSWPLGSDPIFSSGWESVTSVNDPAYVLTNTVENGPYQNMPYNSFSLPNSTNVNQTLAIVVYTLDNLNSTLSPPDQVVFDQISLIDNEFSSQADPQTFDQVLRECQYYYETNRDPGILITTASDNGILIAQQYIDTDGFTGVDYFARSFGFQFKVIKRSSPVITLSNTNGAINSVLINALSGGSLISSGFVSSGNWTQQALGRNGVFYQQATGSPLVNFVGHSFNKNIDEVYIAYHYTADSRLGV